MKLEIKILGVAYGSRLCISKEAACKKNREPYVMIPDYLF
jgi:hypothetical protein